MSNSQHIIGTNLFITTFSSCVVYIIPNNGIYNCLVKKHRLSISKYNIPYNHVPNMYLKSKDTKIIPLSSTAPHIDP